MSEEISYDEGAFMQCFTAGEEAAFAEIYNRFHKRVLFFSLRYVSDTNAQDITAESFVQLWKNRKSFKRIESLSSFLFVTARNRCYNLIQHEEMKERRRAELVELVEKNITPDPEIEEVRLELIALIRQEINRLPEKMRQVFLLSFEEGLKPAQIAELLQISVKTVSNQKLTAIKLLKVALADHSLEMALLMLLQLEFTALVIDAV